MRKITKTLNNSRSKKGKKSETLFLAVVNHKMWLPACDWHIQTKDVLGYISSFQSKKAVNSIYQTFYLSVEGY
jgi:hypothetical protein